MDNFATLNDQEMQDIDGGILAILAGVSIAKIIVGVAGGIATAIGVYSVVREVVRDQGMADAYADGYGR